MLTVTPLIVAGGVFSFMIRRTTPFFSMSLRKFLYKSVSAACPFLQTSPTLEFSREIKSPLGVGGVRRVKTTRLNFFVFSPPQVWGKNIFPYIKSPPAG